MNRQAQSRQPSPNPSAGDTGAAANSGAAGYGMSSIDAGDAAKHASNMAAGDTGAASASVAAGDTGAATNSGAAGDNVKYPDADNAAKPANHPAAGDTGAATNSGAAGDTAKPVSTGADANPISAGGAGGAGDGGAAGRLRALMDEIIQCRLCPRLVEYRELIGQRKRAAYADWDYWARPVPSFGDPTAPLLLLGLAPAAHGGNRTGRVFTGDSSATFLTGAMHQAGLANQPNSDHRDDGLQFRGVWVSPAVRCVPPQDKPTTQEQRTCLPYLVREMQSLPNLRVVLALGGIAFAAALRAFSEWSGQRCRAKFQHGAVYEFGEGLPHLMGCYHPSPRNTNTGRMTREMLLETLQRAQQLSRQG